MSDKRWARKVFEWRGNKITFRKETNRNMKIVNNNENMDITIKGQRVGEERKIQNRVKQEIKKRRAKEMESKHGKEKIIEMYKNKEKPKNEKNI